MTSRLAASSSSPVSFVCLPDSPSKSAAFALLARVYLSMRKYDSALLFANRSLDVYNALLDYNDLNQASSTPFPKDNVEILYQSRILSFTNVLKAVSRKLYFVWHQRMSG